MRLTLKNTRSNRVEFSFIFSRKSVSFWNYSGVSVSHGDVAMLMIFWIFPTLFCGSDIWVFSVVF